MEKSIKQDMQISGKNYNGLDLFKFIMAILVVILHSHPMMDISYDVDYALTFGVTRVAVPFFFVASGFLLYRKMDLAHLDIAKIKNYLGHILRVYGIWTAIYFPLALYVIFSNEIPILDGMLYFIRDTITTGLYHLWFLQGLIVGTIIVSMLIYAKLSVRCIFLITGLLYSVALLGMGYYWIFDYFFPEGSRVYMLFSMLKEVFVTPRDGICFAPIFLFMGAYFSRYNLDIKNIKIIIFGLLVCLMLEVMLGRKYGFNGESDVYITLVPLAFYIFCYARNLQLKDLPAWLYMRKMSMYIFYIHPWFFYLTYLLLDKGKYTIVHMSSMSRFVVCMIFSFAFGQAVITLSKQERFRFLRYLS